MHKETGDMLYYDNWLEEVVMQVGKLYETSEKTDVSFEFYPHRDEKAEQKL